MMKYFLRILMKFTSLNTVKMRKRNQGKAESSLYCQQCLQWLPQKSFSQPGQNRQQIKNQNERNSRAVPDVLVAVFFHCLDAHALYGYKGSMFPLQSFHLYSLHFLYGLYPASLVEADSLFKLLTVCLIFIWTILFPAVWCQFLKESCNIKVDLKSSCKFSLSLRTRRVIGIGNRNGKQPRRLVVFLLIVGFRKETLRSLQASEEKLLIYSLVMDEHFPIDLLIMFQTLHETRSLKQIGIRLQAMVEKQLHTLPAVLKLGRFSLAPNLKVGTSLSVSQSRTIFQISCITYSYCLSFVGVTQQREEEG